MSVVDKPSTSISLSVSNSPRLFPFPVSLCHPTPHPLPLLPSDFVLLSVASSPFLLFPTTLPYLSLFHPVTRLFVSLSRFLSSFTLEISITGSTLNPHQPLCHLQPPTPYPLPLTPPPPQPKPQPLGPACCLVACTVSHRCSSLQRWYSSRQLRSNVQLTSAYDLATRG